MRLLPLLGFLAITAQPALSQPREGYVAADDATRLFYKVEGSGPEVLVVVHGGPGNSLESVRPDFERLAKGRTVIYYDQRGNGLSDLADDERVGIEYHIADLEALRRHFELEKMSLLGNSWGGFLISAYAAAYPDRVERLVLDVPGPPRREQLDQMDDEISRRVGRRLAPQEGKRLEAIAPMSWLTADDPVARCREFLHGVLRAYTFDESRLPPFRGDVCYGPPEAVRRQQPVRNAIWGALGDFDYRPKVTAVTAPVLVIHGAADVIPLEGSIDWTKSFPNARLLIVPRAGHFVHVEQPDIFFSAVDTFLAGGWPAGAEDR